MTAPRVVLDTNVLLSALLFPAHSLAWLRHAWQSGSIRPLASRATTEELIRVLAHPKFALTEDDREHLLGDYLPRCEAIAVLSFSGIPHCPDPFDRPFPALALAAEADALVTGDKGLLARAGSSAVPILTPVEFRERLVEETG
ncbi:MAG: putative toxin-antitoxin system toxin component, PIN family [Defluviicoccus sp.]|nr:putative toxin-antitoxin system toxin component, PIN family [Defluviicoccus sp.]MDE0385518.1 putative toxin-antitoxin system toxin component, PIN family [Defluviicoccus sp.]